MESNQNGTLLPMEQKNIWEEQQRIWLERKRKNQEEGQHRFKKLGLATLLYALFYTFCMYRNLAGITMPLWILATIVYACYALKEFEIPRKKDGLFYMATMLLLGISTVLTGNPYVIMMNYIGFFLLLLSFLLHTIHDDTTWGIGTYLLKITASILGAMGRFTAPFADAFAFGKLYRNKLNKKSVYILLGVGMAVPSMIFLALLLGSADAVFQSFLANALTCVILPTNWFGALALFGFAFLSAYCGLCQLLHARDTNINAVPVKQKVSSILAIAFTAPITLLYVLFSMVQIVYLFFGFGTLPDGISYAEYARTGFFQLLFVCFLNFVLVVFVQNCVEERKLLRGILLTICSATFIMIASSAYRMLLYIGTYQLTFLRILVLVGLMVIGLLMAGVVFSLFQKQFPIYKYSLVVVSVIYLGFSFSHVDYFIASYNLAHTEESSLTDALSYIGTLSTDAAPVIADYMKNHKELQDKVNIAYQTRNSEEGDFIDGLDADTYWYVCYMANIDYISEHSSIRQFNVSHYIATKLLKA